MRTRKPAPFRIQPGTTLTEQQVLDFLAYVALEDGQNALARQLKVSNGQLSHVLKRQRAIGPALLKALKLERVVSYRCVL